MKKTLQRCLWGRRPGITCLRAVLLGICCFFLFKYAIRPCFLDGSSMAPTYRDGAFQFINLLKYAIREPGREDVVVITTGSSGRSFYLKRVLGLPGETVAFQKGSLLINGSLQPESYLDDPGHWDMKAVTLGPEDYFVAGDHRTVPLQQHLMGTVHRRNIRGGLLF